MGKEITMADIEDAEIKAIINMADIDVTLLEMEAASEWMKLLRTRIEIISAAVQYGLEGKNRQATKALEKVAEIDKKLLTFKLIRPL